MNKKKKIIIGIVIALIWILLLVVTYLIAKPKKEEKKVEVNSNENIDIEETKDKVVIDGISIYDTYDDNDLYIEVVDTKYGDYIQISGLKDKNLQTKINSRIKDTFYKLKNTTNNNVFVFLGANFSDILSISMTSLGEGTKEYRENINISLKDGQDINFKDIFTDESLINSILTKTFSYSIAYRTERNNDLTSKQKKEKLAQMEDDVFKIVNNINKGDVEFSLSNNSISVYNGDEYTIIKVEDYGKYFAYPKKYKSNTSLYEDSDVGLKGLLYYDMASGIDYLYAKREYRGDYAFIDVGITNRFQNTKDTIKYRKSINFDNLIKELTSNLNENIFNYVNLDGYFDIGDYGIYSISYVYQVCTMGKKHFNDNIKENIYLRKVLQEGERTNLYYLGEDKNAKCVNDNKTIAFNSKGEEIKTLDDLFVKGYNYKTIIDRKMNDYLRLNNILAEDAKRNLKYIFTSSYLRIEGEYINLDIDYVNFDERFFK